MPEHRGSPYHAFADIADDAAGKLGTWHSARRPAIAMAGDKLTQRPKGLRIAVRAELDAHRLARTIGGTGRRIRERKVR